MKRLSPAKRNQLIGVIAGTIVAIALVYFLLISPQNEKNDRLGSDIGKATARLHEIRSCLKETDATSNALASVTRQLNQAESDIASGDLFAWTYETLRRYKTNYTRVDIPTIGQPGQGDCDLIGNFPYKQMRFSIAGTAFYHDLGKFISDFENKFPHCRIVNLSADPTATTGPAGGEKLNFHLDIIALVKPNN
jgi:hypothetical protein